jgi:hypothetical protein
MAVASYHYHLLSVHPGDAPGRSGKIRSSAISARYLGDCRQDLRRDANAYLATPSPASTVGSIGWMT